MLAVPTATSVRSRSALASHASAPTAAPSLPDGSRAIRLGAPCHRPLCWPSERSHYPPVHPLVRARPRREVHDQDGARPHVAPRRAGRTGGRPGYGVTALGPTGVSTAEAVPGAPETSGQWPIDVSRYDRSPADRAGESRARVAGVLVGWGYLNAQTGRPFPRILSEVLLLNLGPVCTISSPRSSVSRPDELQGPAGEIPRRANSPSRAEANCRREKF